MSPHMHEVKICDLTTAKSHSILPSKPQVDFNMSGLEAKLIYCFGEENSKKDLRIAKKIEELFGDLPNRNQNLIRDGRIRRKLISMFGEEVRNPTRKPIKIIKKRKKSKKLQVRIKKRFDYLFGLENTKRDKRVAKKLVRLFGP